MSNVESIHTLGARDNVILEVMREYLKISPERMHVEIQRMRTAIVDVLKKKGIRYDDLRAALTPSQDRREMALIFDTLKIKSDWYGYDVMERVIPLFDEKSKHSVLVGDYLDRPGHADALFEVFQQAVTPCRLIEYQHPTQFYIVYINNLTSAMVARFDAGLRGYEGYCGFADMTFASRFKIFLSTMLVNSFVKHGRTIIQGHEPDRSDDEDINMSAYPFEENGYVIRSLSSDLMDVLLSYKIERPVFPGFESDTEFALNAIAPAPVLMDGFQVEVADAKLVYLKSEKAGSMAKAGLERITTDELAVLIRAKISESYIYNLSYVAEHDVMKFNVILELRSPQSVRLLAALAYEPADQKLRLVTLY